MSTTTRKKQSKEQKMYYSGLLPTASIADVIDYGFSYWDDPLKYDLMVNCPSYSPEFKAPCMEHLIDYVTYNVNFTLSLGSDWQGYECMSFEGYGYFYTQNTGPNDLFIEFLLYSDGTFLNGLHDCWPDMNGYFNNYYNGQLRSVKFPRDPEESKLLDGYKKQLKAGVPQERAYAHYDQKLKSLRASRVLITNSNMIKKQLIEEAEIEVRDQMIPNIDGLETL